MKNCDLGINKYSRPRSKLFAPNRQVTFFFFLQWVVSFILFTGRTLTQLYLLLILFTVTKLLYALHTIHI